MLFWAGLGLGTLLGLGCDAIDYFLEYKQSRFSTCSIRYNKGEAGGRSEGESGD